MILAKQSTALTLDVGPILDSTGAEYTSAVIGDLTISKNGTRAALASLAELTHATNGVYTLVLTTGNTDTLGVIQITCNKSTYQMPPVERQIVPATVYDAIVTNATTAAGGLGDIQRVAGTAQTAGDLAALINTVDNFIDTEIADIQSRLPAALVSGRMDASIGAAEANTLTASALAADAVTEIQSGLATAAALTSVAGDVTAALADTNELQADWANGGRLDLILDARASQSSVDTIDDYLDTEIAAILAAVDTEIAAIVSAIGTPSNFGSGATLSANMADIEAQTDDIGAAGAGLSAVPWNASWDAEVQSEVTDALNAALTESYRGTGAEGSVAQMLYELIAHHGQSSISSTTKTLKKIDGSTTAKTYTLDSATTPTAITETT